MAFQKKILNPWKFVILQRTPVSEELEMEMLPVLMSMEPTCSKINSPMKVKKKEKKEKIQQKTTLVFSKRKSLI